jgi:hypothetical protein
MLATVYLGLRTPGFFEVPALLFLDITLVIPALQMPAAELAFRIFLVTGALSQLLDLDFVIGQLGRGFYCCSQAFPSSEQSTRCWLVLFILPKRSAGCQESRPNSKLSFGTGLIRTDATGRNLGSKVVLALDGYTRQPAQHGYLADVGQRIGDRTLKELFGRCLEWLARSQISVKAL